jgi:hypothetical protein
MPLLEVWRVGQGFLLFLAQRHLICSSPVHGLRARCPLSTSKPRRTSSSIASRIRLCDIAIGFSVVTSVANRRRLLVSYFAVDAGADYPHPPGFRE